MSVKVTFNKQAIKARISTATEKGTFILAEELLKDSNHYARQDSGVMISASIKGSSLPRPSRKDWTEENKKIYAAAEGSDIKGGLLIWDTPYAKKMYYVGSPVKDENPNASLTWAKKAADENKEKYLRMVQRVMDSEV